MGYDKARIGILGKTNAGKSTLFNLLLERDASIISPIAGTTTDPVRASIELIDYGPVIVIDTAGIDDHSELAVQRIKKTENIIAEIDLALVVLCEDKPDRIEAELIARLEKVNKRYITVRKPFAPDILERVKTALGGKKSNTDFFAGRISAGDTVVLVCPIDSEAPQGKLIMPQVAAIRSALDLHAKVVVVQPEELADTLQNQHPRLVVTDSQAFDRVRAVVANEIELTSFSILLSEQKGDPSTYRQGLERVDSLIDGDKILTIEHCSHQTSCDDIARVKIPRLLEQKTGKKLYFDIVSGRDPLPDDLSSYALVLQCGGCVASREAVQSRIRQCTAAGVKITNYGILLKFLLC